MAKASDKWKEYLANVPGLNESIRKETLADDSSYEFDAFATALPGSVGSQVQEAKKPVVDDWDKVVNFQWCLCELPEGDFPRVYAYSSLERLVQELAKREGTETAVWVMYGIPLQFSRAVEANGQSEAKTRYLFLPNQMAVKISADSPFELLERSNLPDNLMLQEEGWLGEMDYIDGKNFYVPGFTEEKSNQDEEDDNDDDPHFI